ncbi:MAG: PilN domain-containing protein [Cyanobacteriota bacterium]|nr:PilN domain-containing protein [Cyanobacteriota bacterium]
MTTTPLDLLHEQRRAKGLPDPAAAQRAMRRLALKGSLIGAACVAAAVVITGLLVLRQQALRSELDRLALIESQVQAAQARLQQARGNLNTLRQANAALAQGLVNARSGSALMRDLQRRVPQGVQLTTVDVAPGGTSLRLLGTAADPLAFARINAFQIELARSPLLDPTSISVRKAARGGETKPTPGTAVLPAALVGFEFNARFRPQLAPVAELQILRELGAGGMVSRLQRLQAEGLVP